MGITLHTAPAACRVVMSQQLLLDQHSLGHWSNTRAGPNRWLCSQILNTGERRLGDVQLCCMWFPGWTSGALGNWTWDRATDIEGTATFLWRLFGFSGWLFTLPRRRPCCFVFLLFPLKGWVIWRACNLVLEKHIIKRVQQIAVGALVWVHFLPNRMKENAESLFCTSMQITDCASRVPLRGSKGTSLLRMGKGALEHSGLLRGSEEILKQVWKMAFAAGQGCVG